MFRFGLFLGLAIGYVLGAKAGHQRYEQIVRCWQSARGSKPGQQLEAEVREVAHRAGDFIEAKASEGVAKVSELTHKGDGNSTGSGVPAF